MNPHCIWSNCCISLIHYKMNPLHNRFIPLYTTQGLSGYTYHMTLTYRKCAPDLKSHTQYSGNWHDGVHFAFCRFRFVLLKFIIKQPLHATDHFVIITTYFWSDVLPIWQIFKSNLSQYILLVYLSIYLRVYSLHHNVLPTLQSIPSMTNGPLYLITQDSSCHGQHTMPRNPWSFPWPVLHSWVCMNVCVLLWRKACVVVL